MISSAAMIGSRNRLAVWAPELVALLLPVVVLLLLGGAAVLDPFSLGWARRGDTSSHLVGWLFFLREPWSWPPARIESWLVPVGTTIGFADAIPLLAFPFKLVARAVETPFQYFGLWFALCLALQGLLASRLLRELGAGRLLQGFGGALVALSPVVWERFARGHVSLCAQWLILAAFLAWFRHLRGGGSRRSLLAFALLPVVAAAIHPYLTLVVGGLLAGLAVASALRFGLAAGLRAGSALVLSGVTSVAVARAAGFLGGAERLDVGSWGAFNLDLGSFLNPAGWSQLVPELFDGGDHREDFVYLGLGFVLLALVAAVLHGVGRRRSTLRGAELAGARDRSLAGLTAVCGALALLAALPQIELFGEHLVGARFLAEILEPALGPFRANGRLAWPLHLWILVLVLLALRLLEQRRSALTAALALAFGLQAAELPAVSAPGRFAAPLFDATEQATWHGLRAAGYSRVEMVPPVWRDGVTVLCGDQHRSDDWVLPAALAAEHGMSFDSGYVARLPAARLRAECLRRAERLERGEFERETLYLVRPRLAKRLQRSALACQRFSDSLFLCTLRNRPAAGANRRE